MTTAAADEKTRDRRPLTASICDAASAKGGATTEFPDTKERGLALRVTATGVKSWTFRYRDAAGRQKRISLGRYGTGPGKVSLSEARGLASAERGRIHHGEDPATARRVAREVAAATAKMESVKTIGDRYFIDAAGGRHRPNARPKRPSTLKSERYYFDRHVVPRFGKDRLTDISRARAQAFFNDIEKAAVGGKSAARQCRVVLNGIFQFAIWQGLADTNPCRFTAAPSFQARNRVLSDEELRAVWDGFQKAPEQAKLNVSRKLTLAAHLLILTLQRRAEVTGMRKVEVDRETKTWTIPRERTKNHRTHIVPLSDAALATVDEAIRLAGNSAYVFPSPRSVEEDKPIEPAALSHAFRRVCKASGITGIRPHDIRRTGATAMAKAKVDRFIISRVLNHQSDTGGAAPVTSVYATYDYLDEKRAALDVWSDRVMSVTSAENADG